MRHQWSIFVLVVLVLMAGGCAFTDSVITLEPDVSKYTKQVSSPKLVYVQKFTDERGVEPKLVSYKGVTHKTSGKYLCDKDVSDVMTDTIRKLLTQLGYNVVQEGGDFTLSGQIIKFDSYAIMGFWSGSLEANVQMNLKLQDNATRNVVLSEMLSANGKVTGLQIDGEGYRKEVMEQALDNAMGKLANSESLKAALGVK